jgi:hypothetical protein
VGGFQSAATGEGGEARPGEAIAIENGGQEINADQESCGPEGGAASRGQEKSCTGEGGQESLSPKATCEKSGREIEGSSQTRAGDEGGSQAASRQFSAAAANARTRGGIAGGY